MLFFCWKRENIKHQNLRCCGIVAQNGRAFSGFSPNCMGNVAYDWDDQVEKCNKWYEENIKNLVENSSPEENNIPDQGHRRGSSR